MDKISKEDFKKQTLEINHLKVDQVITLFKDLSDVEKMLCSPVIIEELDKLTDRVREHVGKK